MRFPTASNCNVAVCQQCRMACCLVSSMAEFQLQERFQEYFVSDFTSVFDLASHFTQLVKESEIDEGIGE